MFDDQEDLGWWDKVGILTSNITAILGDGVFTVEDKHSLYPDKGPNDPRWPTPRELVQMGKRVVFASGEDYGAAMRPQIFPKYGTYTGTTVAPGPNFANWTETGPSEVGEFPTCSVSKGGFQLNTGTILRVLGDSLEYGPFYGSPDMINASMLHSLIQCGANFVCMDQVTPEMAAGGIWTWDSSLSPAGIEFLPQNSTGKCPMLSLNTGRWTLGPCNSPVASSACVKTDAPAPTGSPLSNEFGVVTTAEAWVTPQQRTTFSAAQSVCPPGTAFAAPGSSRSNAFLLAAAKQQLPPNSYVWVNYIPGVPPS